MPASAITITTLGPHYVSGPLQEHGIPVLMNSAVALEREGQRLWLAGLGSICEHQADPARAIPRAVAQEPVILLAHEPDILPDIARYNVDLMLSGHTHGGQVRIPFLRRWICLNMAAAMSRGSSGTAPRSCT